jgi:hypothetical protein
MNRTFSASSVRRTISRRGELLDELRRWRNWDTKSRRASMEHTLMLNRYCSEEE